MSIWDEVEQEFQQPTQQVVSIWDEVEGEIAQDEQKSSYVKQLIGTQARGWMGLARAIALESPKHINWLLDKTADFIIPHYSTKVKPLIRKAEQKFTKYDPLLKIWPGGIQQMKEEHKAGQEAILKAHPEWESEPPENFLDLLTSPRKLSLAIAESLPLLAGAGVLTAAGQPHLSVMMMYASEGQEAYDQAIRDKATPEQAEQAYHIYGSVAAALEQLQLQQILKIGKKSYQAVLNRTAQKIAKRGMGSIKKDIIRVAAQEAIEEMAQGTWQEVTAKLVYGKDIPGGLWDFIDRRAQEGLIGGVMGTIPGIGGVTLAQSRNLIQGISQQAEITPEESTEIIAEASQQVDTKASVEKQQEQLVSNIVKQTGQEQNPEFIEQTKENVKQLFAEKVSPIIEEKIEKEFVRLYRAEGRKEIPSIEPEMAGLSFTPDIEYAKRYLQSGRKLYYIDVPEKILTLPEYEEIRLTDAYTGKIHEVQLSKELQKKYGGKKIEPTPVEKKPKKESRKRALTLGHTIPKTLGWSEKVRKDFMEKITGKRSMKTMTPKERDILITALREEIKLSGLDVEAEALIPLEETIDAIEKTVGPERKVDIKGLEDLELKGLVKRIDKGFSWFVNGLYRIERMLEHLDGRLNGPNYRHIFVPVTQANAMAAETKRNRIEGFVENLWKIMGGDKAAVMELVARKREHIADATKDNPAIDLAPMERIATYIYAKNKDGLRHLQYGNFANFKNFDAALKQIVEHMSEDEKAIGEWIIQDMHRQFPRVQQAAILALGKEITEQDNYFSLYLKDVDPEHQTDFLNELLVQSGERVSVPQPGEIKKRTKGARQPLRLDAFENYMYHVNRIEQFVHLAPVAKSVGDIINNKKYQRTINRATKEHGGKILKDWLRHSIKGYAAESSSDWGKVALALRRNGIVYSIGYNIPSVLRQQLSGFNAMSVHPTVAYYAAKHWAKGKNPKYYRKLEKQAFEKSQMMRTRNFDRIEIIINRQNPARRRILRKKPWSKKALSWIRWQDRHTTVYAWNSFYDTALSSRAAQATFKLDGSEKMAVDFADKWVGRTQPMGGVEHLPDFFRGGVIERVLSTFQNQINNNFNLWYHDMYQARKHGQIDNTLLAYRVMSSYVLPAIAFGMIARGGPPRTWKDIPFDLFIYTLGPVFIVGRIIYNAVHGFAGAGGGVESIGIAEVEKTIEAAIKGDIKRVAKHGIKAVGALTGRIPAQSIRTAEGIYDLTTDKTDDLRRLIYSEWSLEQGKPTEEKITGIIR